MTNEDQTPSRQVRFTPEFKRNLRHLARKYRRIRSDIQPIIDAIIAGSTPGDRIEGIGMDVYMRARNSDAQRGKSGGYRMIYYMQEDDTIILITLYSKTEQQDIEPHEILAILAEDAGSSP